VHEEIQPGGDHCFLLQQIWKGYATVALHRQFFAGPSDTTYHTAKGDFFVVISLPEIKVCIICDPEMPNSRGEINDILSAIKSVVPTAKLAITAASMESVSNHEFHLLILNYDEFCGVNKSIHQLEVASEWAKNHPTSLLIVWSRFLAIFFHQQSSHSKYKHLNNIVFKAENDDLMFFKILRQRLMSKVAGI
jgi:hypothetical protein